MRNLRSVDRSQLESPQGLELTASTWDVSGDSVLCAFGPTKDNVLLELKRWKNHEDKYEAIASWEAPCPLPDLECDNILELHYFSDSLTACLILAGGDIIVVREEPQAGQEKIEIVGSVDAGISAASWSPDEELLAIATNASTLVYMTRDFDPVVEITFTVDDLKASNHVSVGWGKKETQFKGKKARALRDPTVPETVDEGVLSDFDTKDDTISWRGDGAYVAVNSIESESRRVIRVYSREGILDSVSEPVDGLIGALSWRPAGNLLAGVQLLDDHAKVVFFERNGLRHGQFDLRLNRHEIQDWASHISLRWNVDSSSLAICFKDRIQLWTMGNYHYYLKQEVFSLSKSPNRKPVSIVWHPEKPLYIMIASTAGIQRQAYASVISSSPPIPPHDYGIVAIIDGKQIKLTPMRYANVPPPMALHELDMETNIVDVAVSASRTDASSILIRVYLHRGRIMVYSWSMQSKGHQKPSLVDPQSSIATGDLRDLDSLECRLPTVEARFWRNELEPQINGFVNGNKALHGNEIKFSLSENGSLLANERRLVRNCNSFLVTPAHLIYTTSQHLLKFVHLGVNAVDLEIPPDTPESDERCRSIERGAKLVTVMPSILALVLQMPRGNLETIYPRALVLAGVRDSIKKKRYKKAFIACRNHRVDMNILHDHDPQQFISNVDLFVDQVQRVDHIDLFLSQLRDEDVSKAMYKETLPGAVGTQGQKVPDGRGSKVNRICDAFLTILSHRTATHFQNVVTANVCKSPPNLDAGLFQIAGLREKSPELIDAAIEHICFLADVNRLFDNALGLYDLKLASLVAQQSQKDPKEYVPFLQNLQRMPSLRRQYSIDDYLSRYQKALRHLCDLDAFDEVKAYTIKHSLYEVALEIYRYQEDKFNEVMRMYADYLQTEGKFRDAGIAYEYLNDYIQASESFRQAHLWKESLSCATLIPLETVQLHSLAHSLADALIESKDMFSAATIHLDYLSDVPTAARLYCKGYFFADALRIIGLHQRPDLLGSVIDVGLVEGMASMTELLADCKSQINAQVPRIRELRTKKAEDPLALYDGEGIDGADIPDNVSLAPTDASTTGGSLFTRYTNRTGTVATNATRRTSKNRRREERKRARGKKGSVYEEEYLVNSVGRLIERINSVNGEVERLVVGLMRRGMRERARAVENAMVEVVDLCRGCLEEVFQKAAKKETAEREEDMEGRPKGGEGIVWDSLEGNKPREAPVVEGFARLSLLV